MDRAAGGEDRNEGTTPPRRRIWRALLLAYLGLLVASHIVARQRGAPPPQGGLNGAASLPTFTAGGEAGPRAELTFRDRRADEEATNVVLLHGSPGSHRDFRKLEGELPTSWRLIVPDLPGFGSSTRAVPDYSARTHARYALALLDELGIQSAHVLGFSMGGAVGLELWDLAPERVESLTLLASLGVVELELFGRHDLNQAVHAGQLVGLRLARALLPHFGELDRSMLSVEYARNFYDTDQRRLRPILERFEPPMLILHGAHDFLVPPGAAEEHARIVPQAELLMLGGESSTRRDPADTPSHFILWTHTGEVAAALSEFVSRSEAGRAPRRAGAAPARVTAANRPFDPARVPPFTGPALLLAFTLLALATLVSEDLTCIWAGLLVAQDRMTFVAAAAACFVGIFIGDVLLFLVGKWLGRPALRRAPMKWIVSEESVLQAQRWFERRGVAVIFLSRFVPGLRLSTYFTAGAVGTSLGAFALYFALAGSIWTPALVGLAAWLGERMLGAIHVFEDYAALGFLTLVAVVLLLKRIVLPAFTRRGRRLLYGSWRRTLQFEFWPPWIFYLPVLGYILWLALRHRSLALVMAVNPGIPTGGFIGESKRDILDALGGPSHPNIPPYAFLATNEPLPERAQRVARFRQEFELELPLVLKPDVGQRSSGVQVLRTEEALAHALEHISIDSILQAHVEGPELGLFWLTRPGAEAGEIFSITEKVLPEVTGDGVHTLEQLILADDRAVCMAAHYFKVNAARLEEVPAAGESVRLVELGTHCRGAVFLDGRRYETPELAAAVESLSRGFEPAREGLPGFCFGRYDVRFPGGDPEAHGADFQVLELNGMTAEATHIYDPSVSLLEAYRTLASQWRLAFEIAAANRRAGQRPATLREAFGELLRYRREQRLHRS